MADLFDIRLTGRRVTAKPEFEVEVNQESEERVA
jgi:hypothetical protein